MTTPTPDETVIEGRWLSVGGHVVADPAAKRIETLIREHLHRIAMSPDGWSALFRDPDDGRLWERAYPHSEMHGGGPPKLEIISADAARLRYRIET